MNVSPMPTTPTRSQNTVIIHNEFNNAAEKTQDSKDAVNANLVGKLLQKLPEIDRYFIVHKKIGEGTFSSVFSATSKTFVDKKKFAIKHLISTSHPSRILQELKCLKEIGGQDNIVGLELCFRNQDSVAFVMPYFPHDSFANYVTKMDLQEIQLYMKNLLIALRRVHSFNIIHRDVKPSNFLYNRKEHRFLLVDFGLSHRVSESFSKRNSSAFKNERKRVLDPFEKDCSPIEAKRPALHSLSNNVLENTATADRSACKYSHKKKSPPFKENSPLSKNSDRNHNINHVKRNLQFGNITADVKKDVTPLLPRNFNQVSANGFPFNKTGSSFFCIQNSQIKSQFSINGSSLKSSLFRKPLSNFSGMKSCGCDGRNRICNKCIIRKPMQAPRAGTPGYRSPEVLLKYPHQTTAVDIWSAGVIMLSLLSGSYPFFRAPDDITALMEIIAVFGTEKLKIVAKKLGRNLLCNENRKSLNLSKMCERLKKRQTSPKEDISKFPICHSCHENIYPTEGCLCDDYPVVTPANEQELDNTKKNNGKEKFPNEAYDLLSKLLCVDPDIRYTAKDVLEHPFFKLTA